MHTVAVYLGANRSLTTISSAMMALHPEVTVLNHGYHRMLADPTRNFIDHPSLDRLEAFIAEAREIALGGMRGDYGGHILHAHAFDDEALRGAYLDRFGWGAKPESRCLLWKDATTLTNHVIQRKIAVNWLALALPPLRVVMMVRNPIDMAISSIRNGQSAALVGEARKDNFADVFVHIVRLFAAFTPLPGTIPAQFRFVYQDELLDRAQLVNFCAFLGIAVDPVWLDQMVRLISLRPSYQVAETMKDEARGLIAKLIPDRAIALRVAAQIA